MSELPLKKTFRSRLMCARPNVEISEIKSFVDRQLSHILQYGFEAWGIEVDYVTYNRWCIEQFGKTDPKYLLTYRGNLVHIVQKPSCYVVVHYLAERVST